ncbi:MAG: MarC family protein [Chloroflexota bacterium]|nr:MarC family protein [Chloroflexota bacterium]
MDTLKDFSTILITLLIIMDPLGNLPFFLLFTENNSHPERIRMAITATVSACIILIFFGITGDAVLNLFGISLPAFQIAGGFVFFIYSLQMLRLIPGNIKSTDEEEQEGVTKSNIALVPLATPLIAGPGAITVILVRQQSTDDSLTIPMLALVIVIACLVTYLVFHFGETIHRILGVGGIRVIARLMGLLLAVIAVQFIVDGIQNAF